MENVAKPEEKIRQEGKGTGSLYLMLGAAMKGSPAHVFPF
jgi:hypothetical protein